MIDQVSTASDEISLKEFIHKTVDWGRYLLAQRVKIALIGVITGVVGFMYAWRQPIIYKAKVTFVVEDGKGGGAGLGGLASLAGQFGVDVSSGVGGGLLSGENILLYFKSSSLAREVLLTPFDSSSSESVADVYATVYRLKKSWEKNEKIGKVIFPSIKSGNHFSRLQDSLLQRIIEDISRSHFTIGKTDKKAGFIDVTVSMENEALAKVYCERIVDLAVEKYISIKTQRQKATVDKLQARADSIANLLQQKTISGANLQTSTSTMDINPLYKTGTSVALETTVRDKSMLVSIFTSVTQNLEMAKFTLSQETPVIQIVDSPVLPLNKEKPSRLKSALIFSFISVLIFIFILMGKKTVQNILK